MDTTNGRIYSAKQVQEMYGNNPPTHFREMAIDPTSKQLVRIPPKVGRNDTCPCDSGKKFKKCCLGKLDAACG